MKIDPWLKYNLNIWWRNNGRYVRTFLIVLALGIVTALLDSCKTQSISCNHENDSVRVETRIDSVYLYERDSIYVDRWRSNDTVYLTTEKWLTRYKDKIVEIHDTITTTKEQVIVQEVKYIPKFYKGSTIALWVLIAAIVVYVVIQVAKAIYLRR